MKAVVYQEPNKVTVEEMPDLRKYIAGRTIPSQIVSRELPLEDDPDAYDKFDNRVDGYTRVILKPGGAV